MTRNPWCAPIDTLRDVMYDETRRYVHDFSSQLEGIVKATMVTAAIEIDVALLRALAGCAQPYPVRRVAMGARAVVPIETRPTGPRPQPNLMLIPLPEGALLAARTRGVRVSWDACHPRPRRGAIGRK
jgi:hypothetical protein